MPFCYPRFSHISSLAAEGRLAGFADLALGVNQPQEITVIGERCHIQGAVAIAQSRFYIVNYQYAPCKLYIWTSSFQVT